MNLNCYIQNPNEQGKEIPKKTEEEIPFVKQGKNHVEKELAEISLLEQLFNLEQSLHGITDNSDQKDFFITNIHLFRLAIKNETIPTSHVKKVVKELENQIKTWAKKLFIKNILQPGSTPITEETFPVFFNQAGSYISRMKVAKSIQLQLIYTILYFSDIKLTELVNLTKENLVELIEKQHTKIILSDSEQTNSVSLVKLKNKIPELKYYPLKGNTVLSARLKDQMKNIEILFTNYSFSFLDMRI